MPKRKLESKEDRWLRKMKKYEDKLQGNVIKRSQTIIYSDEEEEVPLTCVEVPNQECTDHDNLIVEEPVIAEVVDIEPILTENSPEIPVETQSQNQGEESNLPQPDTFDPILLEALGEVEGDPIEFGEQIQDDLAKRYQYILVNGLKKEVKEELIKKYKFPANVPLAKPPTLNPEVGAMLAETCKARDKRLLVKQDQLGRALTALGKSMTGLLKKNPDIPEAIRLLNDVGKLLADSHYTETDTRRSVITPLVDKSLMEPFKNRKRDTLLFGENLSELVKNSRGIKKTGQMIQAPIASTSTSNNLNMKSSSSRNRLRNGPAYSYRGGGQRTAYQGRRRPGPFPPPPPPPRRQFAPPPPPPPPPPVPPARRQPAQAQRTTTRS